MAAKPTLLLLQGAFAPAETYRPFTDALKAHGYAVEHPVLPTCSDTAAADYPARGVAEDVAVVRGALDALLAVGTTVVCIMHSYGCMLGNEAVLESHSRTARLKQGLPGGVARLLFMGGMTIPVGSSVAELRAATDLPDGVRIADDGRMFYKNPREEFFEHLSPSEQDAAIARMTPLSAKVTQYKTTNAGVEHVPASVLVLTEDKSIKPEMQEMLAGMLNADVERAGTGHMPHWKAETNELAVKAVLNVLARNGL